MTKSTDGPRRIAIDALSLLRGGGVVIARRLAIGLAQSGLHIDLVVSRNIPEFESISQAQIELHYLPEASGAVKALYFRLFKFDSYCKSIGADSIIGFNYYVRSYLPQLTYHINIIPFIPLRESAEHVGILKAVGQKLNAYSALKFSTTNVFESEFVLGLAQKSFVAIHNPTVAYFGVDTSISVKEKIDVEGTRMVCVTSGSSHKRNDEVVEIVRASSATFPDIRLVFFGDSAGILASLNKRNRKFVEDTDFVKMGGYISRDELLLEFKIARALITASSLESFYMVAVEAMAAGCPAIVVNEASARESVGEYGLLYEAGDIDTVLKYIEELHDQDAWRRHSKDSMVWARKFDENDCLSRFVKLIRSVL